MINFSYSIPCLGKSHYYSSQFLESFRITGLELLVYQITQSMIKSLESRISSIIFTFLMHAYTRLLLCNKTPVLLIKKRERKNSISKESQDSRQNFITPSITNQCQNQSVLIHIDCIIAFEYTCAAYRCFLRHASFTRTQQAYLFTLTLLVTMSCRIGCIYNAYARIIVNKGQAFN